MNKSPWAIVALSTATYGFLLNSLRRHNASHDHLRATIKAISAFHSTATTVSAFIVLTQPWTVPHSEHQYKIAEPGVVHLNDDQNPIIAGKNVWADRITAWETGYLIYDTGALYLEAYSKDPSKGSVAACKRLLKGSPIFVAHHGALIAALAYLQSYIAAGREKGVWVIMAFMCMNASNPLLHLRWWNRKRTGEHSNKIDLALAAVFALTRFGNVYWVMKKYGQYHGLDAISAMRRQRLQCQLGTGVLTSMNLIWWLALLLQMTRRTRRVKQL